MHHSAIMLLQVPLLVLWLVSRLRRRRSPRRLTDSDLQYFREAGHRAYRSGVPQNEMRDAFKRALAEFYAKQAEARA